MPSRPPRASLPRPLTRSVVPAPSALAALLAALAGGACSDASTAGPATPPAIERRDAGALTPLPRIDKADAAAPSGARADAAAPSDARTDAAAPIAPAPGDAAPPSSADATPPGARDAAVPPQAAPDARPASSDGPRPTAGALDLNDVSFLYPLPSWENRGQLLGLASAGARGSLLSRARFDALPDLVNAGTRMEAPYDSLRVVAARVDPCFPAAPAGGCVRQVRLVAQPLGAEAPLTTLDAAVHLLYDLDAPAWERLVAGLGSLRALAAGATQGKPLGVHPVMKAQGLDGPYAKALAALLLEHAGESTLSKVAIMSLGKSDVTWTFHQFEPRGAGLVGAAIPRIGSADSQVASVLFMESHALDARRTLAFDPVPSPSALDPISSTDRIQAADPAALTAGLKAALAIERPGATANPRTVDCATCHLASPARGHAERLRKIDTAAWPERFRVDGFDLRRDDEIGDDARSLRAFGYFGTKSAVSQRVVNESAAVAAALSGRAATAP